MRTTHGIALTATDEEMFAAGRELAAAEGIFAAPEGAATVVAAQKLAQKGWIKPGETVVLFNTGTGYKYSEAWEAALRWSPKGSELTERLYYHDSFLREFDAQVLSRAGRRSLAGNSGPNSLLSGLGRPAI